MKIETNHHKHTFSRDPGSPSESGFVEPKHYAFRFGDWTSLHHLLTFGEPGSLGIGKNIVELQQPSAEWDLMIYKE